MGQWQWGRGLLLTLLKRLEPALWRLVAMQLLRPLMLSLLGSTLRLPAHVQLLSGRTLTL